MRLLPFFKRRSHQRPGPLLSEDKREQLFEAEGKLTEVLADHAMQMDWARRIAQDTLEKLERHNK